MSALERELIERIRRMDEAGRRRVLDFIVHQESARPAGEAPGDALNTLRERIKQQGRLMSMEEFQAFIDEEKADRRW
jgi:hypothetical protein